MCELLRLGHFSELADEGAQRAAELDRPTERIAAPERHLARNPRRR
jgi:hypothetical protein